MAPRLGSLMTSTPNQDTDMSRAPNTIGRQRSSGKSRRLHGLDAARAIAIIGMLAVNVGPRKEPGETDLGVVLYDIPLGRASLLFMILAGIGMSLMTRRSRTEGAPLPWQTIVWRSILLFCGGLALQLLDHDVSVILTYYGVLFLFAFPLLKAPTWVLAAVGGVSLVAVPPLFLYLQQLTGTAFNFVAPSFADPPWTIVHATLLTGAYPVFVWLAPFMLGLILGRFRLSSHRVQHRLIRYGAGATLVPLLIEAIWQAIHGLPSAYGWEQLMSAGAHSQMPLWMISGCGSAVFVIGVFLRGEHWVTRRLTWLVSAGRLSLSIYVTHLFMLAWIVRPGPDGLCEGFIISTIMSVVFVFAAHAWWKHVGAGPLERLLRWPPSLKATKWSAHNPQVNDDCIGFTPTRATDDGGF